MHVPTWSDPTTVHIKLVPPVSSLPLSVEAQTRINLPCVLQLQSSSLRLTDAALWRLFLPLPSQIHDIDLRELFECAHLNFTVSGRSIDRYTRAQCSHASVGLTQARPNHGLLTSVTMATCQKPQNWGGSNFNCFYFIYIKVAIKNCLQTPTKLEITTQRSIDQLEINWRDLNRFAQFKGLILNLYKYTAVNLGTC